MRRRVRVGRVLGALGALGLLPGLLLALAGATAEYPVVRDPTGAPEAGALALGAFHVHSTASDGRGSLEEIALAARQAGLAYVVVTDHNVAPPPEPRRVEGVLLIFGVEVSTRDGHLVVLGAREPLPPGPRGGADAVRWAEAQGAFSVLAHPVQRKNPWKDPDAGAWVAGWELYSADTLFRDALASPLSRLLPAAAGWLGGRVHGVLGLVDGQEAVHRALGARTGLPVAFCSHDAHGLPPYADVFRTMATAVPASALGGTPAEAAARVIVHLAAGQGLCVFQALGPPGGFALVLPEGRERTLAVGEALEVHLPEHVRERATIRAWGPGRVEAGGRRIVAEGEGLLQVEVWLDAPGRLWGRESRPWLVPSPVRVVR